MIEAFPRVKEIAFATLMCSSWLTECSPRSLSQQSSRKTFIPASWACVHRGVLLIMIIKAIRIRASREVNVYLNANRNKATEKTSSPVDANLLAKLIIKPFPYFAITISHAAPTRREKWHSRTSNEQLPKIPNLPDTQRDKFAWCWLWCCSPPSHLRAKEFNGEFLSANLHIMCY